MSSINLARFDEEEHDHTSSSSVTTTTRASHSPLGQHDPPLPGRRDDAVLRGELRSHKSRFEFACRNKSFREAADHHKSIINLRKELSPMYEFRLDAQVRANIRQTVILLMCEDINERDRSLFPDYDILSEQKAGHNNVSPMLWGVLFAKIGFLHMRLGTKQDLENAKKYLNISLDSLAGMRPSPVAHLFPIAQCLADLFDFTTGDATIAKDMVVWLGQKTGDDAFRSIKIGRVSSAITWCQANDVAMVDRDFHTQAMEGAIKQNEPEHLETMLTWNARTNSSGTSPSKLLLTAAETRNMALSQLLFEHKAKVDAVDREGKTVLHRCLYSRDPPKDAASRRDAVRVAGFYCSKDDSLRDRQDHSGKSALYVACEVGFVEMVSFLLGIEANANLTENNAQTPLYMACQHGRRQIVKCLLDKGGKDLDLDARGPGGQTPLIAAVQYAASHVEGKSIVEQLLRRGADPTIQDNAGKTAISYVGGIWATDLKSALRNPRLRPGANVTTQMPSDLVSLAASSALKNEKSQKSSRPPSVKQSMLAKMLQPRIRSASSSIMSPSRTSLESRPAPSVFSNDMSRRTSMTMASSINLPEDVQLQENQWQQSVAAKGKPDGIDNESTYFPIVSDLSRPDEKRYLEIGRDDKAEGQSDQATRQPADSDHNEWHSGQNIARSADRQPSSHDNRLDTSNTLRVTGSVASFQSSTDSDYDTPSESEEASHDGDHSPLEPRTHRFPIRSRPGPFQNRPVGNQGEQSGSFDGSTSIPTPPSEHPTGTVSGKATNGTRQAGSSRGGKVRNATQPPDAEQKRQVLLACPYAKKDPIGYEHCHNYELREIKHVKQHLKRCHLIVVCARCMDGFQTQDLFDQHIRAGGCGISNREPPEGMTQKQHEILKPRTNHKLSLEDQWYFIWETLFPGRERPPTPYKDEFVNLTEFHKVLRDFRDRQIPPLANQLIREMGNATMISHEQAVFMLRRGMLEFASTLERSGILGQSHRPSIGRSGSESSTDAAGLSPFPRHDSLQGAADPNTPDSNGHHQCSPGSTQTSNDDSHHSLQPIDEIGPQSSGVRQDSVGLSQDFGQPTAHHHVQHILPHAPPMHPEFPVQHHEHWNQVHNVQGPNDLYLAGVGAGWQGSSAMDNFSSNPLYSPNNLFNMDQTQMNQLFSSGDFDMTMDVDHDYNQMQGQPQGFSHTAGYNPLQAGSQEPFGSFVMGAPATPELQMPQSFGGQAGPSLSTQQPGDGRGPSWTAQ